MNANTLFIHSFKIYKNNKIGYKYMERRDDVIKYSSSNMEKTGYRFAPNRFISTGLIDVLTSNVEVTAIRLVTSPTHQGGLVYFKVYYVYWGTVHTQLMWSFVFDLHHAGGVLVTILNLYNQRFRP